MSVQCPARTSEVGNNNKKPKRGFQSIFETDNKYETVPAISSSSKIKIILS